MVVGYHHFRKPPYGNTSFFWMPCRYSSHCMFRFHLGMGTKHLIPQKKENNTFISLQNMVRCAICGTKTACLKTSTIKPGKYFFSNKKHTKTHPEKTYQRLMGLRPTVVIGCEVMSRRSMLLTLLKKLSLKKQLSFCEIFAKTTWEI